MARTKKFKIKLDRRELKDPRVLTLAKLYASVEVTELEIGDIVSPNCIVERKTYGDYMGSLVDGRLFDQASRMFETSKPSFIVVHLDPTKKPQVKRQITEKQIYGSFAALAVENGVPVIGPLPDLKQAMYCAIKICEKVEQGKFLKPRHLRKWKKTKAPWCVRKVARLLEIPERVAARILTKYGSIENVAQAAHDLKALQILDGIGYLRALKIRTTLCKDWRKKSED